MTRSLWNRALFVAGGTLLGGAVVGVRERFGGGALLLEITLLLIVTALAVGAEYRRYRCAEAASRARQRELDEAMKQAQADPGVRLVVKRDTPGAPSVVPIPPAPPVRRQPSSPPASA